VTSLAVVAVSERVRTGVKNRSINNRRHLKVAIMLRRIDASQHKPAVVRFLLTRKFSSTPDCLWERSSWDCPEVLKKREDLV
jgi:hypothetical protein